MNEYFEIQNAPYFVPIILWISTGLLKLAISSLVTGKFTVKHVGSGGFPSNHTSIIAGTTCFIGLNYGVEEPAFVLGIALLLIVVFDAAGLRREVGQHSIFLNELKGDSEFRERTGHKLHEVLGGVLWGVLIAYFIS